jgi:hypothetical protein
MPETDSAFGAAGSRCDGLAAVRLLAGLVCDRPPHARAGPPSRCRFDRGCLGPPAFWVPRWPRRGRRLAAPRPTADGGLGVVFGGASSARPHLDVFRGGSAPITRKPQGACSRDSQVAIGLVLDPEGFPKAHEVTVWPPDLFADWVRSPPTFSSMSGSPRSPSGPS